MANPGDAVSSPIDSTCKSGSSWGQFQSFRTQGGGSQYAAGESAGDAYDDGSRLFQMGVSTPSTSDHEADVLHKSPAINQDLDSPMILEEGAGSSMGNLSSHSSNDHGEQACMRCNTPNVELVFSYPCGCYAVCRTCAMKLATGGKCKICKEFYSSFTSMRPANNGKGDGSDSDDTNET